MKRISIYTIPNNVPKSMRTRVARQPLVQIIASASWGDTTSFCFSPGAASAIIRAIRKAAKSASAGHVRKTVEIELERP